MRISLNNLNQTNALSSFGSPARGLTKTAKYAIPIILLTLSSMPTGADAGTWAAAICIVACIPLLEAPPLFAACLTACGAAGAIPGPF